MVGVEFSAFHRDSITCKYIDLCDRLAENLAACGYRSWSSAEAMHKFLQWHPGIDHRVDVALGCVERSFIFSAYGSTSDLDPRCRAAVGDE